MAYNYFPQTYQVPAYYPQAQQPMMQQNQTNQPASEFRWVVGEAGADSYLVAPGQTVQLWDSTAPVFYLKTADSMGRPSKRIFDFAERSSTPQTKPTLAESDFATKEDISLLKNEIESLRAKFEVTEGKEKK